MKAQTAEEILARIIEKNDPNLLPLLRERPPLSQEAVIHALDNIKIDSVKDAIVFHLFDLLEDKTKLPNMAKAWVIWNERPDLVEKWQLGTDAFMKDSCIPNASNIFIVRSNSFLSSLRQNEMLRMLHDLKQEVTDLKARVESLSPRPVAKSSSKFNLE